MASVTTQNLGTAIAAVKPATPQSTLNPQGAQMNQAQLAQLSQVAAQKQSTDPKRVDAARTPQVPKRVEGAFASQKSKPVPGKKTRTETTEEKSKPKADGLMDVVA